MHDDLSSPQTSPSRKTLCFANPAERDAFWLAAIQEQAVSGLSACAFCQSQGLPTSSFHHWKRTLAKRQAVAIVTDEKLGCKNEDTQEALVSGQQAEFLTPCNAAAPVRFAEVRLTETNDANRHSGIEIQCGGFLLRLQPDCDRILLRDLLGMLGTSSC